MRDVVREHEATYTLEPLNSMKFRDKVRLCSLVRVAGCSLCGGSLFVV
jgi:hypothetical protein